MTNDNKIIGAIVVFTLVVFGVIFGLGASSSSTNPPPPQPIKVDQGAIVRDANHSRGPSDAKVTVVEFGDFQCPACEAHYPVLKQILQDYDGKVRLVYRHFPLIDIHPNAYVAALAAEAAASQNKFWEMHDRLFETQNDWAGQPNPLAKFERDAQQLGLNIDQFKKDTKDQPVIDRVRQDMGDAEALGLDSTPTIYINGEVIAQTDPTSLKTRIDALLK